MEAAGGPFRRPADLGACRVRNGPLNCSTKHGMSDLYAQATTLRLGSAELCALVRVEAAGRAGRPKCLLLHGNPSSLADWERIVPPLSRIADVCAIDLPGFGRSPRPDLRPACVSLERFADLTIAAADALGWSDPIYIIGHSHGGGVAQLAAARHPSRVAGIVLLASLGTPRHPEYRMLSLPGAGALASLLGRVLGSSRLRPLMRPVLRAIASRIASPDMISAERLERELSQLASQPGLMSTMVQLTFDSPCDQLYEAAPRIRCPALFVHGDRDALVPARYARNVHERIVAAGGRSEFHLLAQAGHMLLEFQSAAVMEHIARMLNAVRPAASAPGVGEPRSP
jgi:pimeloyl-ACP methyl ester carboxylesterase